MASVALMPGDGHLAGAGHVVADAAERCAGLTRNARHLCSHMWIGCHSLKNVPHPPGKVPIPYDDTREWAAGRSLEEAAMQDVPELWTTFEVASVTRAPVSTVRYWRHIGCGPRSFRLGKRVVYRRTDVESWLAEREAAADHR